MHQTQNTVALHIGNDVERQVVSQRVHHPLWQYLQRGLVDKLVPGLMRTDLPNAKNAGEVPMLTRTGKIHVAIQRYDTDSCRLLAYRL